MTVAWGIETRSPEGHGLVGIYYVQQSVCCDGVRTALWKTRRGAQEHLARVRKGFPKARVVKVKVRLEPC